MYKLSLLIFAAGAVLPLLSSAQESAAQEELGQWDPVPARYLIHSRGASYPEPPTKTDRALTLLIEGKAAKQVFDLIGPDAKDRCGTDPGDRERNKKGVSCVYSAKLNDPRDVHYRCWIGINLRTGEGDVRVSC
jgi:hypothetical protein